jgi:hypothetical protein
MTSRAAGYPPLSVGFIGAIPASKITECITEPAPNHLERALQPRRVSGATAEKGGTTFDCLALSHF